MTELFLHRGLAMKAVVCFLIALSGSFAGSSVSASGSPAAPLVEAGCSGCAPTIELVASDGTHTTYSMTTLDRTVVTLTWGPSDGTPAAFGTGTVTFKAKPFLVKGICSQMDNAPAGLCEAFSKCKSKVDWEGLTGTTSVSGIILRWELSGGTFWSGSVGLPISNHTQSDTRELACNWQRSLRFYLDIPDPNDPTQTLASHLIGHFYLKCSDCPLNQVGG